MDETTEYIDMLYLELSQFTRATTKKELELRKENQRLKEAIEFYLGLKDTGRVEPDNILDKFEYIEKANEKFKKALEK